MVATDGAFRHSRRQGPKCSGARRHAAAAAAQAIYCLSIAGQTTASAELQFIARQQQQHLDLFARALLHSLRAQKMKCRYTGAERRPVVSYQILSASAAERPGGECMGVGTVGRPVWRPLLVTLENEPLTANIVVVNDAHTRAALSVSHAAIRVSM